ncbi:MAG: hypothetical protein A2138_02480 [Deltaproteobacteria bacterium RBG_16_71_12]|nr:MAG: hypothetical protein A2138_02480 [Deltaproteobacteria bacterium RBG_16_71_12]
MNRTAFVAAVTTMVFAALPARSDVDGFIVGVLEVEDARDAWEPNSLIPEDRPGVVPLAGVLIELTPLTVPVVFDEFGQEVASGQKVYARTDRNGIFAVHWFDIADDFPVNVRMSVIWESPDIEDSTAIGAIDRPVFQHPPHRFAIRPGLFARDTQLVDVVRIVNGHRLTILQPLLVAQSDASQAFLTGEEYYRRVIDGENGRPSRLLSDRMTDVAIFINSDPLRGLAPDNRTVHLGAQAPVNEPYLLAHEISHVANWNAYGFTLAPVIPLQYCRYGLIGCVPDGWGRDTQEHERVAWHEGVADALAGLWLWDLHTPGEKPMPMGGFRRSGQGWFDDDDQPIVFIDLTADPRADLDGEALCEAGSAVATYRIPACHAGALWDMLDDPPDDDDVFSAGNAVTQSEVFSAFDDFRFSDCNLLAPNHCATEIGDDQLNHHDFAWNFIHPVPPPGDAEDSSLVRNPVAIREDGIEQVFQLNGITGGQR